MKKDPTVVSFEDYADGFRGMGSAFAIWSVLLTVIILLDWDNIWAIETA